MQLQDTSQAAMLVVRPELVAATLRMLEIERARYDDEDEYGESIRHLIDAVTSAQPINMSAHMTVEEKLDALEFGSYYGSIAHYLMSTIQFALERNLEDVTAHGWRYLSDVAALGADVEPIFAGLWARRPA